MTADLDVLLREVDDVKQQLARHSGVDVDNNLIFESLEQNGYRENRVEFVVKQFLGQDELDEFGRSDYDDGIEYVASLNRGDETIDLTDDSDFVEKKTELSEAKDSISKEVVAAVSDVINVDSESCSSNSSVEVLTKNTVSAKDKRKCSIIEIPKKRRKNQHTLDSGVQAIPSEPLQDASVSNTDHIIYDLYDVNNNDPNNNFEPDSSVQHVDALPTQENKIESFFNIPSTSKEISVPSCSFKPSLTENVSFKYTPEELHSDDEGDVLPELNQEGIREELLREARFIHNLVPHQRLDEIFSYLEANLDSEDRMNVVLLNFLQRDKQRDGGSQQEEQLSSLQLSPALSENPSKETSSFISNQKPPRCTDVESLFPMYSPEIEIRGTTDHEQPDIKMQMDTVMNPESVGFADVWSDINLDYTPETLDANLSLTNETFKVDENEVVQKHITTLTEMFPNLPKKVIEQHIRKTALKDASLERLVVEFLEMDCESEVKEVPPEGNLARESPDTHSTAGNSSSVVSVNSYPSASAVKSSSSEEQEEEEEVEELRYKTLLAIFPDADPEFLRQKADTLPQDDESFRNFITTNLEQKGYPSRKDYEQRQERAAIKKKFSEEFSVQTFLEAFPDPLNYFKERKSSNNEKVRPYAFNYLKNKFRWIRMETVRSVYHKHSYNLTKAFEELQNIQNSHDHKNKGRKEFRLSQRQVAEYAKPDELDVPFLQEFAFLDHKDEIDAYLKEKAEVRQKAFEEAKEKGELLECGCCYDNEVLSEDIRPCEEGHLFCKECVKRSAEIAIGEGKTSFPCLSSCKSEFSLKVLQTVLKPEIFSKMLKRKQLEEIKQAGIEGLETCPFCDFASIPEEGNKIFKCLNPECMKESCRSCRQPSHIPFRCEEVEKPDELKMRTYIEDRMTEALVRECWKCKQRFVKEDGCNKMKCHCGAMMCYVCRQPVKDYTHFNGQGGTAYHKCPLYSNNDELHVIAVEQEGLKAKREVEQQNPDLKLKYDPTKNLPKAKHRYVPHHLIDYDHRAAQHVREAIERVFYRHARHRRPRRVQGMHAEPNIMQRMYVEPGIMVHRPPEMMEPLRHGEDWQQLHAAIIRLTANITAAPPVQPAHNAQIHNAGANHPANHTMPFMPPNVQIRRVSVNLPGRLREVILPCTAHTHTQPGPTRQPIPVHTHTQPGPTRQPIPAHTRTQPGPTTQPIPAHTHTQPGPTRQPMPAHTHTQPGPTRQPMPAHQNVQTLEYIQPVPARQAPPAHQNVQTAEPILPGTVRQALPSQTNVVHGTFGFVQPAAGRQDIPPWLNGTVSQADHGREALPDKENVMFDPVRCNPYE